MNESAPTLLDLENPQNWPSPLSHFLEKHYQLFLGWAERGSDRVSPQDYDRAVRELEQILRGYVIRGWHCTRLTDEEIAAIERDGMTLPNAEMLARRIDAVAAAGGFAPEVAAALKAKNQAHEENRAGRLWFCFFPPSIEYHGVSDFFKYWGGEALYNSHDRHVYNAPIIGKVGTPCIVEADVPIAFCAPHSWLSLMVVRRFLISRGFQTTEPVHHEDKIIQPLPASAIRRIIRFPSPEFIELSGCNNLSERLDG